HSPHLLLHSFPTRRSSDLSTQDGGLWLGKAYGGPGDYWKRDPLHHLSHGATSLQVARFFLLLEQGRLVNPQYSAEIKEILSKPADRKSTRLNSSHVSISYA